MICRDIETLCFPGVVLKLSLLLFLSSAMLFCRSTFAYAIVVQLPVLSERVLGNKLCGFDFFPLGKALTSPLNLLLLNFFFVSVFFPPV